MGMMALKKASRRSAFSLVVVPFAFTAGCATGPLGGGARWSILCLEAETPAQVAQLEQIAETLRHTPGIRAKEVMVMHESAGGARLYYGRYRRRADAVRKKRPLPPRMREDLTLIRQLGDESGRRFFAQAMPAREPVPDVGNPDWVLARVPAKYTLQVAVFQPTARAPNYKKAAAEFCALLRREGYEAYYHHGSAASMVTVGAFGPDALVRRADGLTYYSAEVETLRKKESFKYNLVNGGIMKVRNDDGVMVPVPSSLVEIPHPDGVLLP